MLKIQQAYFLNCLIKNAFKTIGGWEIDHRFYRVYDLSFVLYKLWEIITTIKVMNVSHPRNCLVPVCNHFCLYLHLPVPRQLLMCVVSWEKLEFLHLCVNSSRPCRFFWFVWLCCLWKSLKLIHNVEKMYFIVRIHQNLSLDLYWLFGLFLVLGS